MTKGPLELVYGGRPYGQARPRPDGLWDCVDHHGKVRGVPFPNRGRTVDALLAIAAREAGDGSSVQLRPPSGVAD